MSTTVKPSPSKRLASSDVAGAVAFRSGPSLMKWRKEFGIARPMFAKIADFSERTLATYESAPMIPPSGRRKIIEAAKLILALHELAGDEHNLKQWLQKPNRAFHHRSPLQLITRGESDLIWEMVHQLRQRAFA